VVRAVEVYKKRLIIYSLGNFYINNPIVKSTGKKGVTPIAKITLKNNGELDDLKVISVKQQPMEIDTTNEACNEIRQLSRDDNFKPVLQFH
jgi:poly-gamma-glutamate capsule biosynthesis protein CapA/YwtB (metallophosphatase superfamily)